ncbi:MAG TPA: GMC family oxidoreductase [Chitinophagaceae bacterium]|nr:GMC family oxidoreductase [Chitinophagaceae bacterium]
MHIDARSLENDSLIEGDLCIIGAGAAGISMALDWINSGSKVILLEGGGFDYDPAMQDLYKGTTTGVPYYPLESARLHYFGGTSGHWAGYCSPLDDLDFRERSWVPMSGWPFGKQELDPYYAKAHELLELGPYQYDPDYWIKKEPSFEKLPLREDVIRHKVWQFSPPTRFGVKYRKPIVDASNVWLYTYANVSELIVDENNKQIKEVIITNHSKKTHRVNAKNFVLATCAIQNARLLLTSNKKISKGIGNQHDLVGRCFMDHLEVICGELHMPIARSLDFYMLQFFYTKMRAEIGLSEGMQEQSKVLNGTVAFIPKSNETSSETSTDTTSSEANAHLRGWENAEDAFRKGQIKKEKNPPHKIFQLFTRMEQAPNPASRITLSNEKDALGMPRPSLEWKPDGLERTSIHKLIEEIGKEFGYENIGRIKMAEWLTNDNNDWPSSLGGAWHHMGTTRMNADPKKGVVDPNCKVHDINNLFIAGSSCFPTSGVANPTLTLISLTLRLSAHLK